MEKYFHKKFGEFKDIDQRRKKNHLIFLLKERHC